MKPISDAGEGVDQKRCPSNRESDLRGDLGGNSSGDHQ